jgi:hypothetical protein
MDQGDFGVDAAVTADPESAGFEAYDEDIQEPAPAPTVASAPATTAPAPAPATSQPKQQPQPAAPTRIALRENVPDRYTVKKGDTLWDIATLFLRDPWLWPEIWYFNPQIDNPHLIYPGDVLALIYVDGRPQLRLTRDGEIPIPPTDTSSATGTTVTRIIEPEIPAGLRTVKLSPTVREQDLKKAIPTIPVNAIEPFLIKPQVISKKELDRAPYIVSSLDQHLVSASGHTIYARGLDADSEEVRYQIFRPEGAFKDPKSGAILGYETTLVSEAKLLRHGDPATLLITRNIRETLNGDRILPADRGKISYNFIPKAPNSEVEGYIIKLIDMLSHSAQRQVVVINLGERQGIEVGTVLAIDQAGAEVRDPYAESGYGTVRLPDERAGLLMVFRVFERVSYGLIMESTRTVHINDVVRNPASAPPGLARQ